MLVPLIAAIGELLKEYFVTKREESKAIHDVKMRHMANVQEWDLTMAEATKTSWKDEWFVILLSLPLIGAFTGYEQEVYRGFRVLDGMPDYYKGLLAAAVATSFGMKSLAGMWKK